MKRFYTSASIKSSSDGFTLLLEGKPARTPAGNALVLPHATLARAVAAEWQAQGEKLRKDTMPLTQLACVALDLAASRRAELMADILPYAETDLVCYRAEDTPELAERQAELLDPVIAWAQARLGIMLVTTGSLMPVTQPEENKAKFIAALADLDDWKFAALAASVGPLGSLVLALALVEGRIDAQAAFALSHLEESFETGAWGRDDEKEARLKRLQDELIGIGRFLCLLLSSGN